MQTIAALTIGLSPANRAQLRRFLAGITPRILDAADYRRAAGFLRNTDFHMILCESQLPDGTWRDVLDTAACLCDPPALIVTSRLADNRLWAEVLNLGGYDVLAQPFDRGEVCRVAALAAESRRRRRPLRSASAAATRSSERQMARGSAAV